MEKGLKLISQSISLHRPRRIRFWAGSNWSRMFHEWITFVGSFVHCALGNQRRARKRERETRTIYGFSCHLKAQHTPCVDKKLLKRKYLSADVGERSEAKEEKWIELIVVANGDQLSGRRNRGHPEGNSSKLASGRSSEPKLEKSWKLHLLRRARASREKISMTFMGEWNKNKLWNYLFERELSECDAMLMQLPLHTVPPSWTS